MVDAEVAGHRHHAHAGAGVVQGAALGQHQVADRGGAQPLLQPLLCHGHLARRAVDRRDHHKLISAHAGHHVARAQAVLQLLRQGAQQQVARRMAVAVVHGLEAVQVDEGHQHAAVRALGARQQALQLLAQRGAVGQLGQRVGERLVGQLRVVGLQALQQLFALHMLGDQLGKQLQHAFGVRRQQGGLGAGCAQGAVQVAVRHAHGRADIGLDPQCPCRLRVTPACGHIRGAHAPLAQGAPAQRVLPRHGQAFGDLHLLRVARIEHVLQVLLQIDAGEVGGLQLGDLLQHFQQRADQFFLALGLVQGMGEASQQGIHGKQPSACRRGVGKGHRNRQA